MIQIVLLSLIWIASIVLVVTVIIIICRCLLAKHHQVHANLKFSYESGNEPRIEVTGIKKIVMNTERRLMTQDTEFTEGIKNANMVCDWVDNIVCGDQPLDRDLEGNKVIVIPGLNDEDSERSIQGLS